MSTPVRTTIIHVKPILSLTHTESHRRVINLYKTWYRMIPFIVSNYCIPRTKQECINKLREEFKRHANVQDVRTIDMLLIRGQMELQEIVNVWKPASNLLYYWKETEKPKPQDFMSKFLTGQGD